MEECTARRFSPDFRQIRLQHFSLRVTAFGWHGEALHRWNPRRVMDTHERRTAFATLCGFALAFGWIEASAVVYLREIDVRHPSYVAWDSVPCRSPAGPGVVRSRGRSPATQGTGPCPRSTAEGLDQGGHGHPHTSRARQRALPRSCRAGGCGPWYHRRLYDRPGRSRASTRRQGRSTSR